MSSKIGDKYRKFTDREHILEVPETYTGPMEKTDYNTFVFNDDGDKIIQKDIQIIPGLYKLFDEGVVNCRDHQVRMARDIEDGKENCIPVTNIEIAIEDNVVSMMNDGNGIDVVKHPEFDMWVPEMIFGHLRTSTNYNKNKKKIVGGKNGFGFKLVLIWSSWGKIETVDHVRGLKYVQEFENNLSVIHKPKITKTKRKPYTKVYFKPDFARLKLNGFDKDMMNMLKRRVYDIAAVTDKNVKVKYNNSIIPVKHFQQYIDLYIGTKSEKQRCYEKANERWEFAVTITPIDEFCQVSFVNGIFTKDGGKHVDYITDKIVRKLVNYIKKKKKITVKKSTIKEQIMLFLRCDIENPSFNSQTKDYLSTVSGKFGSTCDVSDKFIEKVAKLGIMDRACALTQVKELNQAKKTDGSKKSSIHGIPKLIDANYAGTKKSNLCTLILCEGDSAKAGIVSGLSNEDRNYIGIYPMRGKMLNVRGKSQTVVSKNKEITEIKKILGLKNGIEYTPEMVKTDLRYGKIVFMTDQDLDGIHIKGLGINLFDSLWKSLIYVPDFIGFMNTPILKARKGKQQIVFYNDGEYEQWKSNNDVKGWKIKYYKGLGTSTGEEFKEYFRNRKIVTFKCDSSKKEANELIAIDMAFNKERTVDRKKWLGAYNRKTFLDTNKNSITYDEFIKKELIHFSKYDCDRSIPNLMDGLKISQRKILFSAFKRNLVNEIKVAQFSGYVSEHSAYHHGEASLVTAIIAMAQDFVGSNNINIFEPKGQFGSRLAAGKDSAAGRYIFTNMSPITRLIFKPEDDMVLDYLDDDGTPVEPIYYAPIIPMTLVNGSVGIGTGFSTDIPSYNPVTIVKYIKGKINNVNVDDIEFKPFYRGFKGKIEKIDNTKYLFKGCYEILNKSNVRITELPVGVWTDSYKAYLETLINGDKVKYLKTYKCNSSKTEVDITVTFLPGVLEKIKSSGAAEYGCSKLEKLLKLYNTKTTTNMHLFNENEQLCKYNNVKDIIDHFIDVRKGIYVKRKEYQINKLRHDACILSNKARFITETLEDIIDLRKKNKQTVIELLKSREFDIIDEDQDYKYLVKMPMDSVTKENVEKLIRERDSKLRELEDLERKTCNELWIDDLTELEKYLLKQYNYVDDVNIKVKSSSNVKNKVVKKIKKKKLVVKK